MMKFEPKRHLIKVQGGRMYLPVSARLIWFRNEHPDWGIETDPFVIDIERQYAIFRAKIYDADGKLMAVGTKQEDIRGFPDYIEKAETGAVGRALALCGFGTQFAPELDEVDAGRFADSPQPLRQPQNGSGVGSPNRSNGAPVRNGNYDRPNRPVTPQIAHHNASGNGVVAPPSPQPADGGVRTTVAVEAAEEQPLQLVTVVDPQAAQTTPACGKCHKPLTRSQQDLSVRHYGEALCPTCQKDRTRHPQVAAAAE